MTFLAIDHVQIAMPPGGEDAARKFYRDIMGLMEVEKPKSLAGRGGCWFESGSVRVHLGVETDFRPAKKAHPAFEVSGLASLIIRLGAAGVLLKQDVPIGGMERVHVEDPFGNRIELLERQR
jgi:catechol 2,3-dioxygenase-like lactoylglutathione lyase family enzyme